MTIIGVSKKWDPIMGSWYVKNSWGTDWGNKGYFWMSYEAYKICGFCPISYNVFEVDQQF